MPFPPHRLSVLLILLAAAIAACTHPEIEQGNYLTRSQVAKVEEGMAREGVRKALGAPLIQDPFHPDRWDYLFMRISKQGRETRRRLTLFFDEQGRVERVVREGPPYPEAYSPEDS